MSDYLGQFAMESSSSMFSLFEPYHVSFQQALPYRSSGCPAMPRRIFYDMHHLLVSKNE